MGGEEGRRDYRAGPGGQPRKGGLEQLGFIRMVYLLTWRWVSPRWERDRIATLPLPQTVWWFMELEVTPVRGTYKPVPHSSEVHGWILSADRAGLCWLCLVPSRALADMNRCTQHPPTTGFCCFG